MSSREPGGNHVEALALAWAEHDALMSWMLAAPDARPISAETLREVVSDYLGAHDPFPEGAVVEAINMDDGRQTWEQATIVGRPGTNEWTVEFADGDQAWRDHTELRPVHLV